MSIGTDRGGGSSGGSENERDEEIADMNPFGDGAIRWICGMEPMREGEFPTMFEVGKNGVTKIEYRVNNLGDHGIGWFDVYWGSRVLQSMQERAVAEVRFADTVQMIASQ